MRPDDWRRKNARYRANPPLRHGDLYAENRGVYLSSLSRGLQSPGSVSETPSGDPDPSRWTNSADRPFLGTHEMLDVPWGDAPLVTHPLDNAPLDLGLDHLADVLRPSVLTSHLDGITSSFIDGALTSVAQERRAQACFYAQWRGLEDHLADNAPSGVEPNEWSRYVRLCPSEPRAPDHSVRNQARLAASLTFPVPSGEVPKRAAPWMFRFTIGPVGAWIRASRTSRDLWTASFLLSEISFAAMLVVVDRFGPDAVVYPDLAFNSRMDRYVQRRFTAALPPSDRDTRTRAALIPNAWLALVPETPTLGDACREAAERRWRELAEQVRDDFEQAMHGTLPREELEPALERWTSQIRQTSGLQIHTATIPWEPAIDVEEAPVSPPSLPASRVEEPTAGQLERRARFAPFVDQQTLYHYERTVWTFRQARAAAELEEASTPGWDYAPTWHMLHRVLEARKQTRRFATTVGEGTTTCTVCGHRDALGAPATGHVDRRRAETTRFWKKVSEVVVSDSGGAERLCGVCATRRYLVPPWKTDAPKFDADDAWSEVHQVWAREDDYDSSQRRLRLPMPSTAAVAAGPWLANVLASDELKSQRDEVVAEARKVDWPKTFFARSLPRVARHADSNDPFTKLEPSMLFDGPREAELDAREDPPNGSDFRKAVRKLRSASTRMGIDGLTSRFAVLAVDGDHLGDLLIGMGDREGFASWRDILHPAAVDRLMANDLANEPWAREWRSLLRNRRLMGPSLHAFINRAGTTFANRLVPWVVEREFHGRLIYAGGDDVLALVPASEALGAAVRLQQLWSAPWVLDTSPQATAWDRVPSEDLETARSRFRVLRVADDGAIDPGSPRFEPHAWLGEAPPPTANGLLLPMLGRHQSVSAGIAYAHFKTPLGLVVDEARRALEEHAKSDAGRAACAEILFTRGGPKYRSVFRWRDRREEAMVPIVKAIRADFAHGRLPGRLPYKLSETAPGVHLLRSHRELLRRWITGSVRQALEEDASESRIGRLVDLWFEGIRATPEPDGPRNDSNRLSLPGPHDVPGLGNLLLCRALCREDEQ